MHERLSRARTETLFTTSYFVTTLTGLGRIYLSSLPLSVWLGNGVPKPLQCAIGGMIFPFITSDGGSDQDNNFGAPDEASWVATDGNSGEDVGAVSVSNDWCTTNDDIMGLPEASKATKATR
ncbi:unnamed protein product [Peronospora belbahrii]|uniref:Uncharacterized protein n=1 Tax=Peronospora belbahrii TaxID=622444 RepID=A0ABN8D9C7_9STRA|nr:unnamed protein product [Peronospora belbahrii]